jgi:hypothetical protein
MQVELFQRNSEDRLHPERLHAACVVHRDLGELIDRRVVAFRLCPDLSHGATPRSVDGRRRAMGKLAQRRVSGNALPRADGLRTRRTVAGASTSDVAACR